ncbi:O-antigen ligase family protein [Sandaracinobacter neustonicus]|uniref:O-antigen ligase family protein n=1 Tax=Sandaracinobacter neustonicus TaxID=1715348 RepID=A0A501XS71_9SPHN|nr:O-antigen ligase family protein [Sandaracinobacter neustonicus]TPE63325.1 O-antigen ligase family protein [Sandaracinobacter neustonicus]
MIGLRDRILPPYTRRVDDLRHRLSKYVAIFALILVAMFMGFWLAVFGTLVVQPFFMLVGVLFLISLWLLDDTEPDLRPALTKILLIYAALEVIWPSYLAVAIPGLPWITPPRLTLLIMMFVVTLQFAQSSRARGEVLEALAYSKHAMWFLGVFWALAFATSLLSPTPGTSFVMVLEWFLLWNMPFVVAVWLFGDRETFARFIRITLWATCFVFVLTVLEYIQRRPIWFGYIPSFLKIEGPLFNALMQEQVRVGDDRYRARGVFAVHLYYAQFILMVTPFILHKAIENRGWMRFWACALLLLNLVIIWMTNTRTGMSGFILVCAGMIGLYALRRFLNPTSKADMVAPGIFIAVPVGILMLGVLIASSKRLQIMTIGGAQTRGSDRGRDMQWQKGWAALETNPFGHGGGISAKIAGRYVNDRYIIDSLWLNFLLDFGVLAFAAFMGFLITTAYYGVRMYVTAKDETVRLMGPAAVAVGGLVLTSYTISFTGNMPFMMMLVGAVYAFRRIELKEAAALKQPIPKPVALMPLRSSFRV